MPRVSTFPILYDECKQESITDLKHWGYMEPNQPKSGIIKWGVDEHQTGSIRIKVNQLMSILSRIVDIRYLVV